MNRHNQITTDIKALEEILELLRITKEYVSDINRTIELLLLEEMLTALTLAVYDATVQTVMLRAWF